MPRQNNRFNRANQAPKINRTPKEKQSIWSESFGIQKIKLSTSQDSLKHKILENDITFVEGPAGTGKSLGVFYTYVREYLKDNTKQIVYIRTPVEAGMDKIGALPDSLEAKIEPHFASAKELLSVLLSKGKVETDMGNRLHFKIPNYCLGSTFDNSLIFIDEAQQLPPLILKLLLERTGKNSRVVVAGDSTQLYVESRNRNALIDAIPRFFTQDGATKVQRYDNIAYHGFDVEDVQRSDIVKDVIRAYSTSRKN
jgi:phosphate starvation-inducible PhoH-like protein